MQTLADLRGGGAMDPRLLWVQILSLSHSFRKTFDQIIGWRPPPLGNPGSTTGKGYNIFTDKLTKLKKTLIFNF